MTTRLDTIVDAAITEGLLSQPDDIDKSNRRWPIIVMTGIISWMISLPLIGLIALVFAPSSYASLMVLSLAILGTSVAVLRIPSVVLLVEQLAVAGLLAGSLGLMASIAWEGSVRTALALAGTVTATVALTVPQNWLRGLLGTLTPVPLVISATLVYYGNETASISPWLAWYVVAGACLMGHAFIYRFESDPSMTRRLIRLEPFLTGVNVMALCGLACDLPVRQFLVEKMRLLPSFYETYPLPSPPGSAAISLLCTGVAALWIAYRWAALRNRWFIPVAATAACLSWFIPAMGGMLLMLVACLNGGYRKLALLAFIGIVWMTSSFYYYLYWPLAHKALLLLGCSAVLATVVRFGFLPVEPKAPEVAPTRAPDLAWSRWMIAGGTMLTLAVANAGIWQKEELIRHGAPIFAELVPIDPRSIMQGDYMRLQIDMPYELRNTGRPHTLAVAQRRKNGIIKLLRTHDGTKLANDELLVELVEKNGWNVLASDAWFFAEGDSQRWSRAKYGEFRVSPDGRALLVGLRGAALEQL